MVPSGSIIGVDVSSCQLVAAWANNKQPLQTIANQRNPIIAWLKRLPGSSIIGMEATGRYHQTLADEAVKRGLLVYLINPKHLAAYARGVGRRGKTDPIDAQLIARYIDRERSHLHPYTPPTALQRQLRDLLSQRANLVRHSSAIRQNLLVTATSSARLKHSRGRAVQALATLIAEIDTELKRLFAAHDQLESRRKRLQGIVGIGYLNSVALTHRFDRTAFANSDAVVAAYGLDPRPRESGNYCGRRHLTKQGNPEDRRLIYLAAQSAAKTRLFKPLYLALLTKGFATTQAIIIIARKLLRIAFAVWKSNTDFDASRLAFQTCKKP